MIGLDEAVSAYGASVAQKLRNPAITGEPEDQIRAPLEALVRTLCALTGITGRSVTLIGETRLADLHIRPDYAVVHDNALVGFIEVKAPGSGADPRRFARAHDRDQWAKLKALPNLLYTDGNAFSLWKDGKPAGAIVVLDGDVATAGAKLRAPPALLTLLADFLNWTPTPPPNARALAEVSARLCRLLRDEVTEQIKIGSGALASLAEDWRKLLFPEADDEQFADGYAQAVTFGLLIARARDISLKAGIHHAAIELRKSNSLIGTALGLLTDDENHRALDTSLKTLARVLDAVHWPTISKDRPEAWLYFYEDFLEVYDNALRKRTGSYYTPPEVVDAMVRLVDEALRGPWFERPAGLAAPDVTVADPATGTGTFLLGVLRRIARTVEEDQGPGAVRAAVQAAAERLYGFEIQFGPFAVAQLRIAAEIQALTGANDTSGLPKLKLYPVDTLADPYVEESQLFQSGPIAKARRDANEVKKHQPITVVIGNPPYKEKAKGRGGWIEKGRGGEGGGKSGYDEPMKLWHPPPDWGVGAHTHNLKNLYDYFWRWAAWKVFGSGHAAATGEPARDGAGIICFITVAGFLNGQGFQKMRAELRRDCSDIWVIDCSPEGHQPEVATRIFQGVQQPVCIVLAVRTAAKDRNIPARLCYRQLPNSRRAEKFAVLGSISLTDVDWALGSTSWRDPFLPERNDVWAGYMSLDSLFVMSTPGVTAQRTWPIAPDKESLVRRWNGLRRARSADEKQGLFKEERDRTIHTKISVTLGQNELRKVTIADDSDVVVRPVPFSYRSLDRQYIIPDHRLISMARPVLWNGYSIKQIFLTALQSEAPSSGPSVVLTNLIPDKHHYNGRGGRVYPLWRDAAATVPNVRPSLLAYLALAYGRPVAPEDVMAYVAAVMAHPAFTARFKADLVRPGLRLPVTADAGLFAEAVEIGREVVWLHCHGERFADPAAGRPKAPPRLPKERAPFIPAGGEIPGAPEPLPDTIDHDPATNRLHVGAGHIANVTPDMWAYEVSGKRVIRQWFGYRKRDRSKPIIGDRRPPSDLDRIQPESWPADYTSDLLDLLNVLGRLIDLEPRQADLLERISAGQLITADILVAAGAIPRDGIGDPEP